MYVPAMRNVKRSRIRSLGLPFVLLAFAPIGLEAQFAADTPRLLSPNGPGGLGVYWVQADTYPGDDVAVLATWAMPGLPPALRLRGGVGKGAADEQAIFGGNDVQTFLAQAREGMPLDLDWQAGAGLGVSDHAAVSVPVGLTAGVSWSSGSVWMAPYVAAGITADLRFGGDFEGEEFEIDPALDVGLDLSLDSARNLVIRAAASFGDRQALAVGAAVGGGSRTR
jgi:hypothetical protein